MQVIRRYWAAGLIVLIVLAHAVAIGYVRSRVAAVSHVETAAFEMGSFRFQTVGDNATVYNFRLHAVIEPAMMMHGRQRLTAMRLEICESCEQLLRQVDRAWLDDPLQRQLRERLMEIVRSHLDEPLVQKIIITDWLEIPVETLGVSLAE